MLSEDLSKLDAWCDANIELLIERIDRMRMFDKKREILKAEITVFDKVKAKIKNIDLMRDL
jgi:hypothetical protein